MTMDEIREYWENLPEEEKEEYLKECNEYLFNAFFKMWLESTNGIMLKESNYDN